MSLLVTEAGAEAWNIKTVNGRGQEGSSANLASRKDVSVKGAVNGSHGAPVPPGGSLGQDRCLEPFSHLHPLLVRYSLLSLAEE